MNLTIDIGNTRTKLALFDSDTLVETSVLSRENENNELSSFIKAHPKVEQIICSTVGARSEILKSYANTLFLNKDTSLPFENSYETPKTLGADRICNAAGAVHEFPGKNVLVIDMGTCITLDMITEDGHYLGGSISNGIEMRFQALNTFTENLPLIAHDDSKFPDLIGRSTEDSIRSGVINGVLSELMGMIDMYRLKYPSLHILLTGGDAKFVERSLHDQVDSKKNEIFADPNLVHIGLNAILNFNVKHEPL